MRERPILFSASMVRAILDGGKTQTRRCVKGHISTDAAEVFFWPESAQTAPVGRSAPPGLYYRDPEGLKYHAPCPYGVPGDRLWVKEAWRVGAWQDDAAFIAVDYLADGTARKEWLEVPSGEQMERLWEQSTKDAEKRYGRRARYEWKPGESPCRARPSMFMPRWASRLTLEVTAVRVERVQDISEKDCGEETGIAYGFNPEWGENLPTRQDFVTLWDSINGKRPGCAWADNPWVWVVEFRRSL